MQLTTTHKLDAASSAVHAVTIFQSDCAEVVRKFAINLKVSCPPQLSKATQNANQANELL
jgi:hypothetical protein